MSSVGCISRAGHLLRMVFWRSRGRIAVLDYQVGLAGASLQSKRFIRRSLAQTRPSRLPTLLAPLGYVAGTAVNSQRTRALHRAAAAGFEKHTMAVHNIPGRPGPSFWPLAATCVDCDSPAALAARRDATTDGAGVQLAAARIQLDAVRWPVLTRTAEGSKAPRSCISRARWAARGSSKADAARS